MFLFQPPTPEEMAAIQEAQNRHELRSEEFRHSVQRLMTDDLDEHQLQTLKTMLMEIPNHEGLAEQWTGMVVMALKMRFNVCITCGVNHDAELQPEQAPASSHGSLGEEPLGAPVEARSDEDEPLPGMELTDKDLATMEKYHIEDVRDEDTHELLHFRCTGIEGMKGPCGATYPSIFDRILREPEHCSGCFTRMGQG